MGMFFLPQGYKVADAFQALQDCSKKSGNFFK